tara:strand:- start:545 stop:781 length:237 start_codon:yes stop_codon:yes gene_type:complete
MTSKRSWRETKLDLEDELAIEITLRIAIQEAGPEYIAEFISKLAFENYKAKKMLDEAEEYIYELEDVVNSLPKNMHNP